MPKARLDVDQLTEVLSHLGERMNWPSEVEIVVVGGAAGMLTGELERRITSDCDVPWHEPTEAWKEIQRTARKIAFEQGLSDDWLNAEARGLARRLPGGWRGRTKQAGRFGKLRVLAIGRLDLIAMKFVAGRNEDRQDLEDMKVTPDEATFVRDYLTELEARHAHEAGHVADARALLEHGGIVHDA